MLYLFAVIYLLCCVISYHITVDALRFNFDYESCDRPYAIFVSMFGPLSIVITTLCWLIDYKETLPKKSPTVIKKKKSNV